MIKILKKESKGYVELFNRLYLKEHTLSRVLQHTGKGFIIISAFQQKQTEYENLERNRILQDLIREKNLGYFEILAYRIEENEQSKEYEINHKGHFEIKNNIDNHKWVEIKKITDKKYNRRKCELCGAENTQELSNFIPYYKSSGLSVKDFRNFGLSLCDDKIFGQDGFIYCYPLTKTIQVIAKNDEWVSNLKDMKADSIARGMSEILRGNHIGRRFIFTENYQFIGYRVAGSQIDGMILNNQKNLIECSCEFERKENDTVINESNYYEGGFKMLDVFKEGARIKGNFSECEAFFISPDNGLYDLLKNNVSNHIGLIINNPEKFGVTADYIQSVYKKYNEKTGTEGSAREEIILEIVKNGWIRGRHYMRRNDCWSINIYEATKRNEAVIYHLAKLVSDKVIDRIGSQWSSFNILETKTGNIMNYTASDILNSKLYNHFFKEDFKGKREEILTSKIM